MEKQRNKVCGADIHKKFLVATIISRDGNKTTERFGMKLDDIIKFKEWVVLNNCEQVAVESTGVYWVPIHTVLEDKIEGNILAGITSYGAGGKDAWLVKSDANGNQQWSKTFGGASDDIADSVQQTSDGGYALAGWTKSYGAGLGDAWLIKADLNGNEQWNRTFGGIDDEYFSYVQQTPDNGYILGGTTTTYGAGGGDAWLVKTDQNGNEHWNRTFGGHEHDEAYAAWILDDGYILAGNTRSYGMGSEDAWLIKTDENGDQQWSKTFGGKGIDMAFTARHTRDGSYVLAGMTQSYGGGSAEAWLIKAVPKIVVDGNPSDWSGYIPRITDTAGDSTGREGTDIKSLRVSRDNKYLYLRMDTWDGRTNSSLSGDSGYTFRLDNLSSGFILNGRSMHEYELRVFTYDENHNGIRDDRDIFIVKRDRSSGEPEHGYFVRVDDLYPDAVGFAGDVIEARIPLSMFNNSPLLINGDVFYMDNISFDVTDPFIYVIEQPDDGNIHIDGYPSDWSDAAPVLSDPAGDTPYTDSDITALYSKIAGPDVYLMLETKSKPIYRDSTLELNLDTKPGAQFTHGTKDDFHLNINANGMIYAWVDKNLDGNMEAFNLNPSDYRVAWGDVLEIKISMNALENAEYINPTFGALWNGKDGSWTWQDTIEPYEQPVIQDLKVSRITNNSAIVNWITNRVTRSMVKYGTIPGNYPSNRSSGIKYAISHGYYLKDLLPATKYYFVAKSTDDSGNSTETAEYNFTTASSYIERAVTTIDNKIKMASDSGNTTLNITTGKSINNALINITEHTTNPVSNNIIRQGSVVSAPSLGRFVEIEASPELKSNISVITIRINYRGADLNGIDENELKLHWWNESADAWETIADSGVDTVNKIVWGNVTHLSLFGIFGNFPSAPATTSAPTVTSTPTPAATQTRNAATSGGSIGGGGGGGTPSLNEPPDNIATVEAGEISKAKAGARAGYAFWEKKTPVVGISFDVLKTPHEGVQIRVQELKDTSRLVNGTLPEGKIYRSININVGLRDTEISNAGIQFRVETSWMEKENIRSSDVSLYRATIFEKRPAIWTKLKTTEIDRDSRYVYFESSSPGFSPFVIIARRSGVLERGAEGSSTLSWPASGTSQDKVSKDNGNGQENGSLADKSTAPGFQVRFGIIGTILVLLAIGIGIYSYMRRKTM